MIVDGRYLPNVSCKACGYRHPPQLSCEQAFVIGNRLPETNQSHPVQLGPDVNSIVYWVIRALDAHYADDDGSLLREPMTELQKLIDMLPADWPKVDIL